MRDHYYAMHNVEYGKNAPVAMKLSTQPHRARKLSQHSPLGRVDSDSAMSHDSSRPRIRRRRPPSGLDGGLVNSGR